MAEIKIPYNGIQDPVIRYNGVCYSLVGDDTQVDADTVQGATTVPTNQTTAFQTLAACEEAPIIESSPAPSPEALLSPEISPDFSPLPEASAQPAVFCPGTNCAGGTEPSIQITVSGGIWEAADGSQGPFNPGTYCVCPSSYSKGANNQYWTFGTNFNDDGLKLQVNAVTTFSKVTMNVDYVADTTTFNTGVTGEVQDRLFRAYTAAGKTITIQRGDNW